MSNSNSNGTFLKVKIGSVIVIILAAFAYFNNTKVDAQVFEINRVWQQKENLEIKQELYLINKKIDILLVGSGYSKSEVEAKLKEKG